MSQKRRALEKEKRRGGEALLALLFALWMTAGRSFDQQGAWGPETMLASAPALLFTAVELAGWFALAYGLARWGFAALDARLTRPRKAGGSRWEALLLAHPARIAFLVLAAAYLPGVLIGYPGKLMGDNYPQMQETLLAGGTITTHHPPLHTFLLGAFLRVGAWLGHQNLGLFLLTLCQCLLFWGFASFGLRLMRDARVSARALACMLAYFAAHPYLHELLPTVTKDVLYMDFLLLFHFALFGFLREAGWRRALRLFACALPVLLLRNEGVALVAGALAMCLLTGRPRRYAACALGAVLAVSFALTRLLYPAMGVVETSTHVREALSVPFQQTARYVSTRPREVTDEQRAAIDAVLDYDTIARCYNPVHADAVKNTYRGDPKALGAYARVWWEMLREHPWVYVEATLHNTYQYFASNVSIAMTDHTFWTSQSLMTSANAEMGVTLGHPNVLGGLRMQLDALRGWLRELPGMRLFLTPALYTWPVLAAVFYAWRRRSRRALALLTPACVNLLVLLVSPVNGFFGRYQLPMMAYLPFLLTMTVTLLREEKREDLPAKY